MNTVAAALALVVVVATPRHASAVQPIEDFVRSAREKNPSNIEAGATREAASAGADQALGTALPGLAVTGSFTHNQYEAAFSGLTFVPKNQLDAVATVSVPLADLTKFARIAGANRRAEAAEVGATATDLHVEGRVVQDYYQLAANLALVEAARATLATARTNLDTVRELFAAGTATTLDVARASAEVERQSRELTGAELQAKVAARTLTSDSGVEADTASGVPLDDDLHTEAPLRRFLAATETTPEVRAAALTSRAADDVARAQELSLVPTLSAVVVGRATNATGFLAGHHAAYAAGGTLSWSFDFGTIPANKARRADASAAQAREKRTRLAVGDAIFQAWHVVEANIARSRSARAEADVSARAAELARTRFTNGAGTQLELIQADRDAFSAQAARIQADAGLRNARAQLRIASGVDPFERRPRQP
jgi:outer membrane protein TolC